MLKRLSKRQREQRRIEEQELVRRLKVRDPEKDAAEASAVAQVRAEERNAYPDGFACGLHPHWQPPRRHGLHAPTPLKGNCPYCAEDLIRMRKRQRERLDVEPASYNASRFPLRQRHLIQAAGERHEERLRAAGVAVAGSEEEAQALERIDQLRDEDRARAGDTFAARRARSRRYWAEQPRRALIG
jgi:hypothetical protein